MGNMFRSTSMDDVIDCLDDRGVGHRGVRNNCGMYAGHGHHLCLGGHESLSGGDGCTGYCSWERLWCCRFACRLNRSRRLQVELFWRGFVRDGDVLGDEGGRDAR